LTFITENFW